MTAQPAFDYVIVGAGSAGCVLANRLSADKDVRVLLLEAGGWDRHPFVRIPLGVGRIWGFQRFDWGYHTEPEPTVGNRSIETARGKLIGGSHSINAMGYVRGNRGDYDRWAASGLDGWSYADILPYFKRAESWEDGGNTYRGGDGPLHVRRTKQKDPLYEAYVAAGVAAGHPYTEDYNGAQQEGFGWCQWTIKNGKRCSTARAYLHPVLDRPNLKVEILAHVTKVVIENGRAVGVQYIQRGETRTARAEREVILSGGTINSPQVLMLSGIGDPTHLRDMGIDTIVDAPGVGRNLQDHFSTGLAHERREPGPFVAATRIDRLALAMAQAYLLGTGPATDVPSGFMAFLKTDPSLAMPDIQYLFRAGAAGAGPWFPGIKKPWQDEFICRPILLRPESRGRISLRSGNPLDKVRIQQNFLATQKDLDTLRAGFKMLRDVAEQTPLGPFKGREIAPGPDVKTDAEIDAYIRRSPSTAHHPAGTCRMGADQDSVVDGELRVRGVEGLRVVDASAMPDLVGGNINAAVILIAEKGADMIRGIPAPPRAVLGEKAPVAA